MAWTKQIFAAVLGIGLPIVVTAPSRADQLSCAKGCVHGLCKNDQCLCEPGWSGVDCNTPVN